MKRVALHLVALGALGCQVTVTAAVAPAPGKDSRDGRVVGWRLVERTYGEADPAKGAALDGEIPAPSHLLLFQPVLEQVRTRDFGALQVRLVCEHEVRLRIEGGLTRGVGESVTANCRIDGPPALYHELSIEPTSGGMEILDVKGAAHASGKSGRYLVPGDRAFQVVFTSRVPGRGTVTISVLREVGDDLPLGPEKARAIASVER